MEQEKHLNEIKRILAQLKSEIELSNSVSLYDINIICEYYFIPVLKILYNCPSLINLNTTGQNYPGIDLACKQSRITFQVSSTNDSTKIIDTLNRYIKKKYTTQYGRLIIFILGEKKRYTSSTIKELAGNINLNIDTDIIDFKTLYKKIVELPLSDINEIYSLFVETDKKYMLFKKLAKSSDKLLERALANIQNEKDSKKYIPDVFHELTSVKQKARFFSHPQLFYKFLVMQTRRLDFTNLNSMLDEMGIAPISLAEDIVTIIDSPRLANENIDVLSYQLKKLLKKISKFSLYEGNSQKIMERYFKFCNSLGKKTAEKKAYDIFFMNLGGDAGALISQIKCILESVQLIKSKVFILTGNAGQGKTNFLCDFTENFCSKHQIPTIYISAKDLNKISDCDIMSYITNNRYLHELKNKFEFFEFAEYLATKKGLPFLVIIDGINEVSEQEKFNIILADFIESMGDFQNVKLMLTCRTEFFDRYYYENLKKFNFVMYRENFVNSGFNENQKKCILQAYLEHFSINCTLSQAVSDKLSNDLLLLRIFCETYSEQSLGYINSIYKTMLFEDYFKKLAKLSLDGINLNQQLKKVIFEIVEIIIETKNTTQIEINDKNFDIEAQQVIDNLIHYDILLRRDLPQSESQPSLLDIEVKTINFTFDELRDYLIAFYIIEKVQNVEDLVSIMESLSHTPAIEGVLKFTYLLSRRYKKEFIYENISSQVYFDKLYVDMVKEISSTMFNETDTKLTISILSRCDESARKLSLILLNNIDNDDTFGVKIITDCLNQIEEEKYFDFLLMCLQIRRNPRYYSPLWRIVSNIQELSNDEASRIPKYRLAFYIHILAYHHKKDLVPDSYQQKIRIILQKIPSHASLKKKSVMDTFFEKFSKSFLSDVANYLKNAKHMHIQACLDCIQ